MLRVSMDEVRQSTGTGTGTSSEPGARFRLRFGSMR